MRPISYKISGSAFRYFSSFLRFENMDQFQDFSKNPHNFLQ